MSRWLSGPDVGLSLWTRFVRKLAEREIEEAGRLGFSMGGDAMVTRILGGARPGKESQDYWIGYSVGYNEGKEAGQKHS